MDLSLVVSAPNRSGRRSNDRLQSDLQSIVQSSKDRIVLFIEQDLLAIGNTNRYSRRLGLTLKKALRHPMVAKWCAGETICDATDGGLLGEAR